MRSTTGRPKVGRKPLEFLDGCLDVHGQVQAGGRACVDVPIGDLGRLAGRSAGTASYYVRSLEEAGLLLRRQPLVVDLAAYHRAGGRWRPAVTLESEAQVRALPTVSAPLPTPEPPAQLEELLAVVTTLVGHVASLAATVASLASQRDLVATGAANPATDRDEEGRQEDNHREAITTSSLPSRPNANAPQDVDANDRDHIDALLDRLLAHRRVDPRQLTARDPLRAALAGHPAEHREHAVERLLADLDAGRGGFTNVFGCLHHKAMTRDTDYFRSPLPKPERSTPRWLTAEPEQTIDTVAVEAVRAMPDVERAELGAAAERRARSHTWFRESLFRRLRDDPSSWELELAAEWRRRDDAIAS